MVTAFANAATASDLHSLALPFLDAPSIPAADAPHQPVLRALRLESGVGTIVFSCAVSSKASTTGWLAGRRVDLLLVAGGVTADDLGAAVIQDGH